MAGLNKKCIVYSVGSDNSFEFERYMYFNVSKKCEIHTFDPWIGEVKNKPGFVNFHSIGLAGSGETRDRLNREWEWREKVYFNIREID